MLPTWEWQTFCVKQTLVQLSFFGAFLLGCVSVVSVCYVDCMVLLFGDFLFCLQPVLCVLGALGIGVNHYYKKKIILIKHVLCNALKTVQSIPNFAILCDCGFCRSEKCSRDKFYRLGIPHPSPPSDTGFSLSSMQTEASWSVSIYRSGKEGGARVRVFHTVVCCISNIAHLWCSLTRVVCAPHGATSVAPSIYLLEKTI